MSYEHCSKHDAPATNGCDACMLEGALEEAREFGRGTRDPALAAWAYASGFVDGSLNYPAQTWRMAVDRLAKVLALSG